MPKDKRPYITVALDMPDHPKYAALTRAQKFLVIEGWIHCAKYKTDGFMDLHVWSKFGTKKDRFLLTNFEIVREVPERKSVEFIDYLNHQSSRAEIEAKQNQARSAGQKGGRAKAAKASATPSEPLATATDSASEPSSGSLPEVRSKKLEVEEEQKTRDLAVAPPIAPKPARYPEAFEEFWGCYPRTTGKIAAGKAWEKAIKLASPSEIIEGALRYANDPNLSDDEQFIPHPSRWLNEGRWDDGPLPARQSSQSAPSKSDAKVISYLERGQRLAAAARNQNPQQQLEIS